VDELDAPLKTTTNPHPGLSNMSNSQQFHYHAQLQQIKDNILESHSQPPKKNQDSISNLKYFPNGNTESHSHTHMNMNMNSSNIIDNLESNFRDNQSIINNQT
jgi:hypothetical protein